jgi:putative transposase
VEHVIAEHGVSERFACRVLGQHRSRQRKAPTTPGDEAALTADIIALATQYGRYGYRRIAALLRDELLNGEIFYTLKEAKVIIERWRRHYNTVRPHSSLGYRPPAPKVFVPARPASQSGPATPSALSLAPRPILN